MKRIMKTPPTKKKKKFNELSPNTIVYEIFRYLWVLTSDERRIHQYQQKIPYLGFYILIHLKKDSGCFGTFKFDELKNVWNIFKNVWITCSEIGKMNEFIICWEKIEILKIFSELNYLLIKSSNLFIRKPFPTLKSLYLSSESVGVFEDFKFPNLEELILSKTNYYCNVVTPNHSTLNFKNFKNLKYLKLDQCDVQPLFSLYLLKLTELIIIDSKIPKDMVWCYFPKLKYLKFYYSFKYN